MDARLVSDASLEAATRAGVSPRHFEKDFYVTRTLRQIFAEHPDEVVFKGGTSLSKAYALIDRFSEDIDLLIDPAEDTPERVELILDAIDAAGMAAVGVATTKVLEQAPGLMRKVNVQPAWRTQSAAGISKSIQLESGRRGGPLPQEKKFIKPLLADAGLGLAGPDMQPFEVTVLHPARTLVEKLLAASNIGDFALSDGRVVGGGRGARHFYDIYQLLGDASPARAYLQDQPDSMTSMVRDCEEVSQRWYSQGTEPITGSLADSPSFTDPDIQGLLETAFDQACAELCAPGAPRPSWSEVTERVLAHRDLLTVEESHA
ncbi:nucleotidyl transferase AbiEii/AbiGii toxin family protein [Frigoribacterium sp. CFBP 8766]|uniref:nucleotidyl transferase AbiEii/AbiGii toxin family protein n=1 Tax=Frigoribacterium sp. CFBP 8766 TaxID=2775273 RepID=UPI00177D0BA5|nr:nucleotidyl transferase AbiEii/AbiGii toxin family protein [Frigoribacterium sp. CFBP 8766]MBD8583067.1 nucleotidyl transferase AbiEii/AbiGii toxin family protein [Frigoribacterium sp. CFBP 8766]